MVGQFPCPLRLDSPNPCEHQALEPADSSGYDMPSYLPEASSAICCRRINRKLRLPSVLPKQHSCHGVRHWTVLPTLDQVSLYTQSARFQMHGPHASDILRQYPARWPCGVLYHHVVSLGMTRPCSTRVWLPIPRPLRPGRQDVHQHVILHAFQLAHREEKKGVP